MKQVYFYLFFHIVYNSLYVVSQVVSKFKAFVLVISIFFKY
uniref:Uncharacterized protein n=1 Tax=Rhizophora mucronata TaxID=61149 RepID=A0A2P2PXR4_RHIMU